MTLEQIYTKCLAQGAYFISSQGEAVIIDPLREVQSYLDLAKENKSEIKYIFLTHFHADFVSSQVDLAKATGAIVVLGPNAKTAYDYHSTKDGEIFQVGALQIEVIHTPGHTMESICYLMRDEEGEAQALFMDDTLFIGDLSRPDLAAKSDLTTEDLAGHLYDSVHNCIMPLPDHIIIYPAHRAGSACGKNMSRETSDTLGNQKETNYAFKLQKQDFIKELITGLVAPPSYFPENVAMNKRVNTDFDTIIERGTRPLSVQEFEILALQEDVLALDRRSVSAFAKASLPQAWFIGLSGQFAPWVGVLVQNIRQKIIFFADEGKEEEVAMRLSRVGYDHSLGYLKGGIEAWIAKVKEALETQEVTAQEFVDGLSNGSINHPVDVRKDGEFARSHIEGIQHLSLDEIHINCKKLNPAKTYHVHCAGGYRSLMYASVARSQGVAMVNVLGGYAAIEKVALGNVRLTA